MDVGAQTRAILDRLVACPSIPGQANDRINACVTGLLSACGARVLCIPSPLGDAEGVIASIGPDVPGGVILSGHSDVVAVDGQDWSGDPFTLRRDGSRLIGRGTTDMKGFVACALALMQEAAARVLRVPVHLFLSADEETACQSVSALIAHARAHMPPVRGVIIGEPTSMRPVDRHKASATQIVEVTGRSAHASISHKGLSATAIAARLITWLEEETARNAARATGGGFDPNHSTHTVGIVNGGNASNTVAEHCHFTWDMRLMPDERMEDVLNRFDTFADGLLAKHRNQAPEAKVVRRCDAHFPGLKALRPGPFREEISGISQCDRWGAVSYGTEAGFFQDAGFDTVIWGPGDIAQAHTPDEYIELEQLELCLRQIGKVFV